MKKTRPELKKVVEDRLRSIGRKMFVTWYESLKNGSFIDDYRKYRGDGFNIRSANTIQSNARSIFASGQEMIALQMIIDSPRIKPEDKEKARNLLAQEIASESKQEKIDLSQKSVWSILRLYSKIVEELRFRAVLRTRTFIGDIGEFIVKEYYTRSSTHPSLELSANSNKNFDAHELDNPEITYQIKTVTQTQTGVFKNITTLEDKKFDYLVVCEFTKEYALKGIYQLSWDDFFELKKPNARNAHHILVNGAFFERANKVYQAGRDDFNI